KSEENHRDIEKIAMQILQDEGKCRLAAIRSAALADHTGRGVEKERAIIGLPVVVAGHAESQRAAQNQQRGRKQPPMVMGVDQRRIKRGEVWRPLVETALKGPQSGVKAEPPQQHNNRNNLDPPGIVPLGSTEAAPGGTIPGGSRLEEHTSELQSPCNLVCRLLLEKKKKQRTRQHAYARLRR